MSEHSVSSWWWYVGRWWTLEKAKPQRKKWAPEGGPCGFKAWYSFLFAESEH